MLRAERKRCFWGVAGCPRWDGESEDGACGFIAGSVWSWGKGVALPHLSRYAYLAVELFGMIVSEIVNVKATGSGLYLCGRKGRSR